MQPCIYNIHSRQPGHHQHHTTHPSEFVLFIHFCSRVEIQSYKKDASKGSPAKEATPAPPPETPKKQTSTASVFENPLDFSPTPEPIRIEAVAGFDPNAKSKIPGKRPNHKESKPIDTEMVGFDFRAEVAKPGKGRGKDGTKKEKNGRFGFDISQCY